MCSIHISWINELINNSLYFPSLSRLSFPVTQREIELPMGKPTWFAFLRKGKRREGVAVGWTQDPTVAVSWRKVGLLARWESPPCPRQVRASELPPQVSALSKIQPRFPGVPSGPHQPHPAYVCSLWCQFLGQNQCHGDCDHRDTSRHD